MSKKEKILERLKQKPKDFTYDEAKRLLENLGFKEYNKGKTSGSRVSFSNDEISAKIELHKPHPKKILKSYVIKNLIEQLKEIGVM